jgi:prepilin-type N-terminal cleavage/methylation domain-containing protein
VINKTGKGVISKEKHSSRGFTLIEVVVTIVIASILAAVALKSIGTISQTSRIEQTRQEMNQLAFAIAGNPALENGGVRTDFGFVGDVGIMPLSLDVLYQNTFGYPTWNGPYIGNRFNQLADDYNRDAWNTPYVYAGGTQIISVGSGSNIVRKVANNTSELVNNRVGGAVLDVDGTPPGYVFRDSVLVRLTVPTGAGGLASKARNTDPAGNFGFDSIPIGNHDIEIIYLPDDDTLKRFVSVLPNSTVYNTYRLADNVWYDTSGTGGVISGVPDSDTLRNPICSRLIFWVTNISPAPVTVGSMILTWSAPSAYYRSVLWNGTLVRGGAPSLPSGATATFSSARTLNPGESAQVTIDRFRANAGGGGPPVDMTGATFTVTFSAGSTFSFTADLCTS